VNANQRIALAAGLALLAGAVLYPPWQSFHRYGRNTRREEAGRALLFTPPQGKVWSMPGERLGRWVPDPTVTAQIKTPQVLIEAGTVIVLTGGVILLLKRKPTGE
jgi:hypothetical protein